jgi:hypothetical protein
MRKDKHQAKALEILAGMHGSMRTAVDAANQELAKHGATLPPSPLRAITERIESARDIERQLIHDIGWYGSR